MSSIKVLFRNYDNDMKLSMLTVLATVMNFFVFSSGILSLKF